MEWERGIKDAIRGVALVEKLRVTSNMEVAEHRRRLKQSRGETHGEVRTSDCEYPAAPPFIYTPKSAPADIQNGEDCKLHQSGTLAAAISWRIIYRSITRVTKPTLQPLTGNVCVDRHGCDGSGAGRCRRAWRGRCHRGRRRGRHGSGLNRSGGSGGHGHSRGGRGRCRGRIGGFAGDNAWGRPARHTGICDIGSAAVVAGQAVSAVRAAHSSAFSAFSLPFTGSRQTERSSWARADGIMREGLAAFSHGMGCVQGHICDGCVCWLKEQTRDVDGKS